MRRVMKTSLLVAVMIAGSACGAYQFGSGTPSPTPTLATVNGHVLAVPCSPVEQAGSTCAGRPVPNLEIDYVTGATIAARTITNADGTYATALKPGSYDVRMRTYMRVISGPLKLTVAAGSSTAADYILDSGIRAPVPQQ